jgi:putative hemolysin
MVPGPDSLSGIILIALSILGIAFFSSSESALISLNKLRIRKLAEQGKHSAQRLQRLIQKRDQLVGTILLAENGLIVFASVLTTVLAVHVLHRHSASWSFIGACAALMTVVVVLMGEILPKTFAAQNADRYALLIAFPLSLMVGLLKPLVWVLTSVTRVYVHLFNVVFRTKQQLILPFVTEEELRLLLNDVQEQGVLEREETEMIHSVMLLGDTSAREVMVPRIDMVCLPVDAPFDVALHMAISEGHSRIPVYLDSTDNIIGVLYVKDLLGILQGTERPEGIPEAYIRPAYHVPESKKVDELLREMRAEKVHLAIVLDEYGGTAGLITIEDILEEIVGDIQDEYDTEEALPIQHQPDGSLVVEGRVSIDEVSELLGIKLPTEDFDTIGGFVVGLLGRAPTEGEQVSYEGVRLQIVEVSQRRVARVRLWRRDTAPLMLDDTLAEAGFRDAG